MSELALQLFDKYYKKDSIAYEYLYTHSIAVTQLAVKIAKHNKQLNPDIDFIKIAAFLHDIPLYRAYRHQVERHHFFNLSGLSPGGMDFEVFF